MGKSCNRRHGMAILRTPEYETWKGMRQRVLNPKNSSFAGYGGRGIKICERWSLFENFLLDMGTKPGGMTLERVNNNGNYEPSNCIWATPKTQANNRRSSCLIEHSGLTLTRSQWAVKLGMRRAVISDRLDKLGWSVDETLTTPSRTWNRKGEADAEI